MNLRTPQPLYEWVDTWVHVVESATGRLPMIYTGLWQTMLNDHTEAWGCPLWIADWHPPTGRPSLPHAWKRWTLWQYTDAQSFDGIAGTVDASYFNGSRADLLAFAGGSRTAATRPPHVAVPAWPGRVLKEGMDGGDVLAWQHRMRERGFVNLATDRVFDSRCAEGCRWLQLYLRQPPTGEVDAEVWRATWTAR
jgi:hypothetical protein